jgi:hypothetical protein
MSLLNKRIIRTKHALDLHCHNRNAMLQPRLQYASTFGQSLMAKTPQTGNTGDARHMTH